MGALFHRVYSSTYARLVVTPVAGDVHVTAHNIVLIYCCRAHTVETVRRAVLAQHAPCLGNGKGTGFTEHLPEPHVHIHALAQQATGHSVLVQHLATPHCSTWQRVPVAAGGVSSIAAATAAAGVHTWTWLQRVGRLLNMIWVTAGACSAG